MRFFLKSLLRIHVIVVKGKYKNLKHKQNGARPRFFRKWIL